MKKVNGYYVMNEAEYARWIQKYEAIMNDINSSDELLEETERFNELVAIEN
jgi:hypothetical protein